MPSSVTLSSQGIRVLLPYGSNTYREPSPVSSAETKFRVFWSDLSEVIVIDGIKTLLFPVSILATQNTELSTHIDINYRDFSKNILRKVHYAQFRNRDDIQLASNVAETITKLNEIFNRHRAVTAGNWGETEYVFSGQASVVEIAHNLNRYIQPIILDEFGTQIESNVSIRQPDRNTLIVNFGESGNYITARIIF